MTYGGDGGIRTHVPVKATRFRVELVMTTSIRLHASSIVAYFFVRIKMCFILSLMGGILFVMVEFIISKVIKDYRNVKDAQVRSLVGRLCGIIGIVANVFLFGIKFLIGVIVGSVSIQADAINNLTDAGSNIISILSFYFSNKPADEDHPFGHERTETIASLFVALMIAYLGIEMARESFTKILSPDDIDFRWVTILILMISILVKLWMYSYNKRLSKVYDSKILEATALDSISDVLGTSAVLVSTCISGWIHINLDGYMGLVVSGLILYNAYGLLRDVINSLLGEAADPELVRQIASEVMKNDLILGVHDLIVHNYGPNKKFASAHVEVDAVNDIFVVHDQIDNIERQVKKDLSIELVLHMDPVRVNDPETDYYRNQLKEILKDSKLSWTFHDFRIVSGPTHVNLVFDLVVPYEEKRSIDEIRSLLESKIKSDKQIYLVMTIDHPF